MECHKCGHINSETAKICNECGELLKETDEGKSSVILDNILIQRSPHAKIIVSQSDIESEKESTPEPTLIKEPRKTCPICYTTVKDDYFKCPRCERDFIHIEHREKSTEYYEKHRYLCLDCLDEIKNEYEKELAGERNILQKSTIHKAAEDGNIELIELYLKHGIDIDKRDGAGNTPLHRASLNGHIKTAILLMENGANINVKDKYSNTPLHHAARKGHTEMATLLVEQGVDIAIKNNNEGTALYLAFKNAHYETLAYLAEYEEDKVKVYNKLLLLTAKSDKIRIETAAWLVRNGADIDTAENVHPYHTPLHEALEKCNTKAATWLVENGANIDAITHYGQTYLHEAVSKGRVKSIELLLELGANIDIKNKYGDTPLHQAVKSKKNEMVAYLVLVGADTKVKDGEYHKTPLEIANKWKYINVEISTFLKQCE